MRVNLISNLSQNSSLDMISRPNQVYAWFLHKAFISEDIDSRLVNDTKLKQEHPPETDYTIVISAAALKYMIEEKGYAQRLRDSTKEKLTCYMNTDGLRNGEWWFDHCFTQIEPRIKQPKKYVCAGWGVDPEHSYPEQDEKAAFLDSKVIRRRDKRKMKWIYQTYDDVLPNLDLRIYNPSPTYKKAKRLTYPDYQAILRKCHYYLCTQFGEGGLNRLEAAACGSLLVVPASLYVKKTMMQLNHRIWYTGEDLIEVLGEPVDIEANRKRALEHRWSEVVKRMLKLLEK